MVQLSETEVATRMWVRTKTIAKKSLNVKTPKSLKLSGFTIFNFTFSLYID